MEPSLVLVALALLQTGGAVQDPVPVDAPPAEAEAEAWEFSGSVYYSHPPDSEDRLTTILYGDRGPLHLELRYNYEDLDTASFFVGRSFEFGEEVALTPMLGAVAGGTDGIAPGLEFDVGWKKLAWYAEMEYLFDAHDSDDDYFYSWSTLLYGFTDWLSAGVVTERSRVVDTGLSLQRGLALELKREHVGLSLYAYNLDDSDDFYAVVSVGFAP